MASFFSGAMNRWFGFNLNPNRTGEVKQAAPIAPTNSDGAVTVASNGYSIAFDPDLSFATEKELIDRYRTVAMVPEVKFAIENIVNEAIVIEDNTEPVQLNIENEQLSDQEKAKIREAWDKIIAVTEFNTDGYQIFERWYIDGKIYYYVILDQVNGGIAEIRQIDPRKIKKVKIITREMNENGVEVVTGTESYYVYTDDTNGVTTQTMRLHEDSVVFVHSGLIDSNGLGGGNKNDLVSVPSIQSYLHTALKPSNQLSMLEEAIVIYRLVRAPERRAFYIDVDGLPNGKADQYFQDNVNKLKNRTTYNSATGEISDGRRHMSMIEDFFLPRRNGKATEITTLPGGQGLGEIADMDYFRDKLISSLHVPKARFMGESGFQIGKSDQISRDEITFGKFITKLRNKFNAFFYELLRIELISSGIIENDTETWNTLKNSLKIIYSVDNHFSTLKDIEILSTRLELLSSAEGFAGEYLSKEFIFKNVLGFTDDEIKDIAREIRTESGEEPAPEDDQGGDFDFGNDFGGGGGFSRDRDIGGDSFSRPSLDTTETEPDFQDDFGGQVDQEEEF